MPRLNELTPAQIRSLLAAQGQDVSEDLIAALQQFVASVGSVANALEALDAVGELKEAA
jgi:hypothetical protein